MIKTIEFAQSHVLPAQGLSWELEGAGDYKLVENRNTLLLASVTGGTDSIELHLFDESNILQYRQQLDAPDRLPPSEGGDIKYSDELWSITIPAEHMKQGISVQLIAAGQLPSAAVEPDLYPEMNLTMYSLPFLIYGANDDNMPLSTADLREMLTDDDAKRQASAGMPFSATRIVNHPLGLFESSYLIQKPSGEAPAKKIESASDPSYMSPILDIVWQVVYTTGDMRLNNITYAPAMLIDHSIDKKIKTRGLGGVAYLGSGASMGYPTFGLLWHEGGHAMSLSHSLGDSRNSENPLYPYKEASLKGSAWGYDEAKGYFRSPLTTPTSFYYNCGLMRHGAIFQKTTDGRCYRLEPMHSADEQKDPDADFPLFSDFSAGKMQKWMLGRRKLNASGDGFQLIDEAGEWQDFIPVTTHKAAWDIKEYHPVSFDKTTDFILFTHSFAGTDEITQFYNPIRYQGNAIAFLDPTNQSHLDNINFEADDQSQVEFSNYCKRLGCDYTLKVTYSDGSVAYRIVKDSARKQWEPTVWKDNYQNENHGDSFRMWSIAIVAPEGQPAISKLELLDTPMLWRLTPSDVMSAPAILTKQL
ncbi:hypothetical protein CHH28_02675 [Bacterioplanes sanyensis]|uniref:Peptidase M66 domain-containing protein n=1 Tax=Bacterioplanes sanyensis TaxID=1249553 RepID=A0A222FGT4_9GAMM|nr:M66 family metalloprotease [Bacterioplanes sanyensis]ASP37641.1 hypothetical protein CHH28_02675 [Bacterioplanes sanyensis]